MAKTFLEVYHGRNEKQEVKTFLELYKKRNERQGAKTFLEIYREKYIIRVAKALLEVYFEKYNENHDRLGRFASSGASATGVNQFKVQGFANKQKLNNHWQNGRTHQGEYEGWTKEQYVARALELVQSPVGDGILGHKDKDNVITRYDVKTNDFVKGNPEKGIRTLFKPVDGIDYYNDKRQEDVQYGGEG